MLRPEAARGAVVEVMEVVEVVKVVGGGEVKVEVEVEVEEADGVVPVVPVVPGEVDDLHWCNWVWS